jgi:hypothetical protein
VAGKMIFMKRIHEIFLNKLYQFILFPSTEKTNQQLRETMKNLIKDMASTISEIAMKELDKSMESKLYDVLVMNPESIAYLYTMVQRKKEKSKSPEQTKQENPFLT